MNEEEELGPRRINGAEKPVDQPDARQETGQRPLRAEIWTFGKRLSVLEFSPDGL
jgi:hypothetical protein